MHYWTGWRNATGGKIPKPLFAEYVDLTNEIAYLHSTSA